MQPFDLRPCKILLVEDNPGDVILIREAFKEGRVPSRMTVVGDGEEAIRHLKHESANLPDLILLDLNLPKKDGREVLRIVKCYPELRRIPILVLTTSSDQRDVLEAYRLHANSYLTKPTDLEEYFTLVRAIETFWMKHARLPQRD